MTELLSKRQIEKLFVKVVKKITNLDDNAVRISYQKQGQPPVTDSKDYCYVSVGKFDSEFTKPIDTTYENTLTAMNMRRDSVEGIICKLVLYGENSNENAQKIRRLMGVNAITAKDLRLNEIFYISDPEAERRIPYQVNQQWLEQVFLELRFYHKVCYNVPINPIEHVSIGINSIIDIEIS